MDVSTEGFQTGLLILLEQGRAGKADEDRLRQNGLHCFMEFAGLGAMALVDKYIDISLGTEILGQGCLQVLHILVIVLLRAIAAALAELMYQGADQPMFVGI